MITRARALALLAALMLASCATPPPPVAQACPEAKPCPVCPVCPGVPEKPKVPTLAPVSFAELPGWREDDLSQAWPAFRASCRALRFRAPWREACARAEALEDPNGAAIRAFFEANFVPYRVANGDGTTQGLVTGYYEPVLRGSRERRAPFSILGLAHSILAKSKGIKINSIALLIFGGISSMEEETPDPKVELPMAAIGPLTSLAVGILCIAIMYVVAGAADGNPPVAGVFVFMFGYLGLLNVFLFGFNLLPAFPMDGGRVLRAFLARSMPLNKATRIAADVGKVFAVLFGILGIFLLNPIMILIAFFIYIGASQESTAMKYNFLLKDVVSV